MFWRKLLLFVLLWLYWILDGDFYKNNKRLSFKHPLHKKAKSNKFKFLDLCIELLSTKISYFNKSSLENTIKTLTFRTLNRHDVFLIIMLWLFYCVADSVYKNYNDSMGNISLQCSRFLYSKLYLHNIFTSLHPEKWDWSFKICIGVSKE